MLNLVFIGVDCHAFEALRESAKSLALIEHQNHATHARINYKCDGVIIDLRNGMPEQRPPLTQCLNSLPPIIALIELTLEARCSVFEHGFLDYLAWPIVDHEIKQRLRHLNAPPNHLSPRFSQDSLVERCCRHMAEHIDTTIRLPQVCKAIGTNQASLTQRFNIEFGTTPMAWLRVQRLKMASGLLLTSNTSVHEVAQRCGYSDSNNFATAFRARFGVSPSKFRKLNKSKKLHNFPKD